MTWEHETEKKIEVKVGFQELDDDNFFVVAEAQPWVNNFDGICRTPLCKHAYDIKKKRGKVVEYKLPHIVMANSGSDPGVVHICVDCIIEARDKLVEKLTKQKGR